MDLRLLGGLAATSAVLAPLWMVSLRLRNASIADIFWGPSLLAAAGWYALSAGVTTPRQGLVLLLVALWAARLAISIWARGRGHGEDPRYRALRERDGASFWWTSLFRVFLLQAFLAWIISAPLFVATGAAAALGPLDIIGALLWLSGFALEAIADEQLRRFRADPAQRGAVLRSGLWAWSRHPNYFGEALLWWGIFLIALSAGGWWTVFAPVLLVLLLVRVSGVALLERGLRERRPGYAAYISEVPAFVPRRPRPARPVADTR